MKKIYSVIAIAVFALAANAQENFIKPMTAMPVSNANFLNNGGFSKTASTSTLMPSTFNPGGCATNSANIVYYSAFAYQATTQYTYTGVGYSFGTNSNTVTVPGFGNIISTNDRAAQKYNVTGNVSVTDILVATNIAQGTGVVSAKVYSENAVTLGPDVQIGTTATKALNTFTGYDALTFGTPVMVSAGNFFASIESPAIGGAGLDTLCILATNIGCSSTDSLAWVYTSSASPFVTNGWSSTETALGGNVDLLIFPVVDISTGINNSISKGNLTLLAAFPNPATNDVTINFGLNQSSKVEIEIYDVTGKNIRSIKLDTMESGNHSSKISLSDLNAGVYMYSVKSDNAKMFSKFTVAK